MTALNSVQLQFLDNDFQGYICYKCFFIIRSKITMIWKLYDLEKHN